MLFTPQNKPRTKEKKKSTHQRVLINQPSISQALGCEVINRIHGDATTSEGESAEGTTHACKMKFFDVIYHHKKIVMEQQVGIHSNSKLTQQWTESVVCAGVAVLMHVNEAGFFTDV